MNKPEIDFFVIGAARSGTTSLYRVLEQHPDVFVPTVKEPRFFAEHWDRGWDWYTGLYKDAPTGSKRGDFSPNYTNSLDETSRIVPRLHAAYPDAKLIYMVRNPIACAISNWRMTAELLGYELPFGEALEHEDWALSVYHRACFFRQITPYRAAFGDDPILAVPLEGMRRESDAWILRIQDHIGVSGQTTRFLKANASRRKPNRPAAPEIPRAERMKFLNMVGDDARAMLAFMGQPETLWALGPGSGAWEPE